MENSTKYIETYTIKKAISQHQIIASQYPESSAGQELLKEANWLRELSLLNDETPLTEKFLSKQFLKTNAGWRLNFDNTKILIQQSGDTYHILLYKREYEENKAYIKTVGQLRMFLTICGLEDFVKQLN